MQILDDKAAGFVRLGPAIPATPLVISVPHAGRVYPDALRAATRLPVATLEALEDRFADRLVSALPSLDATIFIARRSRAWIDLNRDERELDPAMIVSPPPADRMIASAKIRGGLGLIPRRVVDGGDIWRRQLTLAEIEERITADHRPWHQAIAEALKAAHACFGVAMLIDLHSMPPILSRGKAPGVVLGDRHGRSCAGHLVDRLLRIAAADGHLVSRNTPYAGGHTLERHGRPQADVHAVQIEIDRALYLAPDMRATGPGLDRITALVARFAGGMLEELAARPDQGLLAAE